MDKQNMPYQFQSYEPGVFVELYLPKRAKYQGKLYETLVEGFNVEKVKNHFLDPEKRARIYELLEHYSEVKNIEERIDSLEKFYWGYSMYEVDGVFFRSKKGIEEERTQVIRIIFLPDLKRIHSLVPELDFVSFRRLVSKTLKVDRDEREHLREKYPQLVEYINNWIGDVGLFIFGYLVFQLCLKIKELYEGAEGKLEDEIWVSSFWAMQINRVKISEEPEPNNSFN